MDESNAPELIPERWMPEHERTHIHLNLHSLVFLWIPLPQFMEKRIFIRI